ncbi:putative malate/L-lactate dehydrogenase [Lineolata rhizophorae]|uniref:Putative malate/L-lactate dehydrogenase n=1 Tax=Lineolata rhizophorae TaxID=578093 RepID=A0A6A6P8L7_9PEZI|nr:putative malate/L-lactate dehydrogenase [Lineolata rhizophorae]
MTDSTEPAAPKIHIAASRAHDFVAAVLAANGVPADHASTVASCLVEADLRGHESHGINRLPSYVARLRSGAMSGAASPAVAPVTPCVGRVDAANCLGAVAARAAMAAAVDMAKGPAGIGLVGVRASNHFGMAAWVVQQAVDAGLLCLVFTNSSPALPPWGARDRLLGVSPIACGAPAGPRGRPFVLDMAPSVAARGKVYRAERRGEAIPEGWALDRDGAPTTDPARALEGVMLPVGGPKGSALAIMMDVFAGVLTGSAFAGHVASPYDASRPADVGHFFVALRPDLFVSANEFRDRMDYLYQRVVGAEKMQGVDRVYFPGEIELVTKEERERTGIPYVEAEIAALNEEARHVGVEPISE